MAHYTTRQNPMVNIKENEEVLRRKRHARTVWRRERSYAERHGRSSVERPMTEEEAFDLIAEAAELDLEPTISSPTLFDEVAEDRE